MAQITFAESVRQIQSLVDQAEEAMAARRPGAAVERWRSVLAHPCAHHQVLTYEVLDEIHRAYRDAGRYDDAIAAKREAIAAGYRSVPDPEADIAECLLEAGRVEEAEALFATLRARAPEDVWLYNSAAFSYAGTDMATSLRWALDGIEVALATGDPDQVVMQLLELAEDAWDELGEPVDRQLVERVERFCDEWTRPPIRGAWSDAPAVEDRPCAHCGYRPQTSRAPMAERARHAQRGLLELEVPEALDRLDVGLDLEPAIGRSVPISLAFGWFPADQWAVACERWPDLLDERPADHLEYSHATEARIKTFARHAAGHRLHVVAMTVDGLEAHAERSGDDPGTGEARAAYAATLLGEGDAVAWPPGRNEPCWCRSGRKYKKCCGPVPAAGDDEL
ncbi:MAG: SEC-C metal-binding domain-containing protein [Actinomycetes bacterium]